MKQSEDLKQTPTNDDMIVLSDLLLNIKGLHPVAVENVIDMDDDDTSVSFG